MHEETVVTPIHIGRYVDPLTDYGFKRIFTTESNKDLLIDFLNDLFQGRKFIVDLTYNKNEDHGPQNDFRTSIYDLTCTGKDGEQFIIEMQRMRQAYFKDRAVYYTSTLIHGQGPKGEKHWDYELKEVYLIGIMNFCFEDTPPDSYLHNVHLTYDRNGQRFYDKLEYIFIEIPKFCKSEQQLSTDLDCWLYALKYMGILDKNSLYLNKRIFQKLFTIAEICNLSKEEFMQYERSLMAEWDQYAVMETAKDQAVKDKLEVIVKKALLKGSTIAEVADMAEVSEAFVLEVKKNMQ